MRLRFRHLVAALTVAPALAAAQPSRITVSGGWTRPTPAGMSAAGYLVIANNGARPERLVGAASPGAARVTLHRSLTSGGVAIMREVPWVAIPPHRRVLFAPGGWHLMLERVRRPLRAGQRLPLELRFAGAGSVRTSLTVRGAGASMPGMAM